MTTSPLEWIGTIASYFGSFVPRWVHLECWQAGVLVKRGTRATALEPGITWYWPYWSTVYTRPANRQTVNLPAQTLMTADGEVVAAGCMVRYKIDDALQALVETEDVDQAIADETVAVLREFITARTLPDVQADPNKVNTALTLKTRSQLRGYGVQVERAQLTDFARGRTLIHVGLNFKGQETEEE